jgi:hypothetical protein
MPRYRVQVVGGSRDDGEEFRAKLVDVRDSDVDA